MDNVIMIFGLTILGITFISICNIICFLIGAKTFQNVHRGEEIKLPNVNPIDAIKKRMDERRERKEAEKEAERLSTMLENINNYRGDSTGQKDIPS